MHDRLSRREFTLVTASAASVALAGCSDDEPVEGNTGDGGTETDGESPEDEPSIEVEDDAEVYFRSPVDGDTIANGATLDMAADNFTIESAGDVNDNAGHFHVVIDEGPVDVGEEIPDDDSHRHFGDGSTRTVLDLSPGTHELTLQAGDGEHRALSLSETIEVTVEEASVSFAAPEDGATVENPVAFEFATSENLEVKAAGELSQNAGHFHVVVNEPAVEVGEEIPDDDAHFHFGDGSTEAELELPEGDHDLVLQMGDGEHLALPETDELSITVEGEAE